MKIGKQNLDFAIPVADCLTPDRRQQHRQLYRATAVSTIGRINGSCIDIGYIVGLFVHFVHLVLRCDDDDDDDEEEEEEGRRRGINDEKEQNKDR